MVKILIVEDEPIVAKDIRNRLQKMGYTVFAVASSGKEAVEKVKNNPDLVLMDIVLRGDMDGIEAADVIRAQADIPIVYVTAHADEKTLQRAKVTEPYGYILKPFENRELHTIIEMALYKHKMEKKVKENEQWLSTTLKSIGDGVITTDMQGIITFMNPVAEALTGWTQKAVGKPLDDVLTLIREETGEQVENPAKRVLRKGGIKATGRNVLKRNGVTLHVDGSAAPLKDDKGNTTGAVVVLRDITARTRVEQALKKTEKLYEAGQRELEERRQREEELREKQKQLDDLLTNVNAIVLEGDDTQILFVAGQVEDLLGYSRNQWVSHKEGALGFWRDHVHPDDHWAVLHRDNAVREGLNYTVEYQMIAADGHTIWVQDSTTVEIQKELTCVRSVMVDITKRKTQEEELLQLSAAVKMSSDSIIITDMEENITDANEAALTMYRARKREDFIGKKVRDIVAPEDYKRVAITAEELLKKGYGETQEYDIITNDSTRITLEANIALIKAADGTPKGSVSICRDITERKKAEREMKKKLMRYNLEEGTMYLAKERTPCTSVEAFQDLLIVGYPGLVISRTPKREFITKCEQEFDHLWIAEKGGQYGMPPALKDIGQTIETLPKATAVFIDRLDYLRSKTRFEKILSFVQRLRETAYLKNHVVILSVDPSVLDMRELRQIEKETAAIEPWYKTKLPEELFNTLKVIYEQNTKGVNPSYTMVGYHIGASKPTIRKRIRTLMSYGYVTESKKGRSKVVSLTEKGRTLFLK